MSALLADVKRRIPDLEKEQTATILAATMLNDEPIAGQEAPGRLSPERAGHLHHRFTPSATCDRSRISGL